MRHIIPKLTPKALIKHFLTSPPSQPPRFHLSTLTTTAKPDKLNRIATELLSLNAVELHDYSILFGQKMGLKTPIPGSLSSGLDPAQSKSAAPEKIAEKTVFDIKIDSFEAASKIKIIKEVRGFTELGLKEAKSLVESVPAIVKSGVTREDGDAIVEKLKALGAKVVLE